MAFLRQAFACPPTRAADNRREPGRAESAGEQVRPTPGSNPLMIERRRDRPKHGAELRARRGRHAEHLDVGRAGARTARAARRPTQRGGRDLRA